MFSPETRDFLEKVAYGDAEHKKLLRKAFRHVGHHTIGQRAKELISRGDLGTDYGIRTPPLLVNDVLHGFQSSSRSKIRGSVKKSLNTGIKSLADSITTPDSGLFSSIKKDMKAARGFLDIGTAHHTLMDLTAHNEKMQEMGLGFDKRRNLTGFGGATRAIKQHLDHAMEMDLLHMGKNQLDRRAVERNKVFIKSLVPKLKQELKSRGIPSREATRKAKSFFRYSDPGTLGFLGGMTTRNIAYIKDRIGAAVNHLRGRD